MKFNYSGKTVNLELPEGTGNVAKKIKKGRFYESNFLKYIAKQNLGGVYIDVGANIGNHSVFFGLFTSADRVISFEPHPDIFKILQKNIKSNRLQKKVSSHNAALGEKTGKCALQIAPSDEIGGAMVVKGDEIDQWKLDRFVDEKITLIKVDVEGHEEFVIKGADKVLTKHKPELFLELTNKTQYKTVYNIISKYGYEPIGAFNNSATYHFSATKKSGIRHFLTRNYLIRRVFFYS